MRGDVFVVRTAAEATATRSQTHDAVRFQNGWTASPIDLPLGLGNANHIEDQWQSRPGSAEYTMRLSKLSLSGWERVLGGEGRPPEQHSVRLRVLHAEPTVGQHSRP